MFIKDREFRTLFHSFASALISIYTLHPVNRRSLTIRDIQELGEYLKAFLLYRNGYDTDFQPEISSFLAQSNLEAKEFEEYKPTNLKYGEIAFQTVETSAFEESAQFVANGIPQVRFDAYVEYLKTRFKDKIKVVVACESMLVRYNDRYTIVTYLPALRKMHLDFRQLNNMELLGDKESRDYGHSELMEVIGAFFVGSHIKTACAQVLDNLREVREAAENEMPF